MEASERTISQVLTEQLRYQIPPYQRPYSWEAGNVTQLLDDVWEAYLAKDAEYFIGSLITIEVEEKALYDVVDGQQRLTTLNLILARLRDHIDDQGIQADLGQRILPKDVYSKKVASSRLTLRSKDQSFFLRYALNSEVVDDAVIEKTVRGKDTPQQRIAENLLAISKYLNEKPKEDLPLLAQYLLNKVYVVFVMTKSFKSAYRLFNVLNARGMQLSNADLIKNSLFGQLGKQVGQSSKDLEDKWLELEGIIGIDQMDNFLGHHRASITGQKAKGSLNEEYKTIIEREEGNSIVLMGKLIASAENYSLIQGNDFEDGQIKRAVMSLQNVVFEDWIPPLLTYLNSDVSNKDVCAFVQLLEKITMQNWIRRIAFTARMTVYFTMIADIISSKGSIESLNIIVNEYANNEEFLMLLGTEIYGKPFAKAVLLALEEAETDDSVSKLYSGRITIEHVLPQALKDIYWQSRYSEEEHREWLHKLGNLALLSGTKNYRAQYFGFDRKKKIYADRGKKVSFDTTKQIIEQDDWLPKNIEERHAKMINRAKSLWWIDIEMSVCSPVNVDAVIQQTDIQVSPSI